jgi:hypothetical protein
MLTVYALKHSVSALTGGITRDSLFKRCILINAFKEHEKFADTTYILTLLLFLGSFDIQVPVLQFSQKSKKKLYLKR